MPLNLKRPIAVIDLETSDFDEKKVRIVSIGISIIGVDGNIESTEEIFVDPEMKISKAAIDVHGITNEMVKGKPKFGEIAGELAKKLADCDLAGYNIDKFDLPILVREFEKAGIADFGKDAKVIDVMRIYHKNNRQNLEAAVALYLDKTHEEAHSAAGDAKVTAEILLKQVEKHGLPGDAEALQAYCREKDPDFIDQDGKFIWQHSEAVINFGKLRGIPLKEAAENNRDYLEWILTQDFSDEMKGIVRDVLDGIIPRK